MDLNLNKGVGYYTCSRIGDLFCLLLSLKFQLEVAAFFSDKTSQLV